VKRFIRPMLETLVSEPFHRGDWVYEEKYDGDRVIAYRHAHRGRLVSRNLKDVTAQFQEIARALVRSSQCSTAWNATGRT
jgi:bifunctional non-homologous end joining protein LigD